jgi:hypothetical protein
VLGRILGPNRREELMGKWGENCIMWIFIICTLRQIACYDEVGKDSLKGKDRFADLGVDWSILNRSKYTVGGDVAQSV